MQIGVNHIGHFYLTKLLWPKIKTSQDPRVINLSSAAHKSRLANSDIDFEDFHFENSYTGIAAYSRSKKANVLFSKELQRKMDEAKISGISVSVHPGVVRTELVR